MRKVGLRYVVKVTSGNRVTIPAEFRRKLGLRPGDKVVFVENGRGYRIETARKKSRAK